MSHYAYQEASWLVPANASILLIRATRPRARFVDTLRQQGMQPQQQVVFLSGGAETLRGLQQNIAPEAEHVLDWFHVIMRLTVLGQMIKGAWADAVTVETKAAALDRIKWLLWHGNAADNAPRYQALFQHWRAW